MCLFLNWMISNYSFWNSALDRWHFVSDSQKATTSTTYPTFFSSMSRDSVIYVPLFFERKGDSNFHLPHVHVVVFFLWFPFHSYTIRYIVPLYHNFWMTIKTNGNQCLDYAIYKYETGREIFPLDIHINVCKSIIFDIVDSSTM